MKEESKYYLNVEFSFELCFIYCCILCSLLIFLGVKSIHVTLGRAGMQCYLNTSLYNVVE